MWREQLWLAHAGTGSGADLGGVWFGFSFCFAFCWLSMHSQYLSIALNYGKPKSCLKTALQFPAFKKKGLLVDNKYSWIWKTIWHSICLVFLVLNDHIQKRIKPTDDCFNCENTFKYKKRQRQRNPLVIFFPSCFACFIFILLSSTD